MNSSIWETPSKNSIEPRKAEIKKIETQEEEAQRHLFCTSAKFSGGTDTQ